MPTTVRRIYLEAHFHTTEENTVILQTAILVCSSANYVGLHILLHFWEHVCYTLCVAQICKGATTLRLINVPTPVRQTTLRV